MNYKMYLAFLKWCFMKIFGGCFATAESFRYELKKGAPDSIFAISGFLILSLVFFIVTLGMAVWLIEDRNIVNVVAGTAFWLTVFALVYNIIKAAFECFCAERQELFEILKRQQKEG